MAESAGEAGEQERAAPVTPCSSKSKAGTNEGASSSARLCASPSGSPRPHITCVATASIRRRPRQKDPISGFVGFHVAGGEGLGGTMPTSSLAGRRYLNMVYVNTCNGVVLLASEEYTDDERRRCILWNPAVADVVEEVAVPDPPAGSVYLVLGLGYGRRSKTYKLLLCLKEVDGRGHRTVKSLVTYALGSGLEKKEPKELSAGPGRDALIFQRSLYMDGKIYVLNRENLSILAFDVDDETVTCIYSPIEIEPGRRWGFHYASSLMELSGRPCVATDSGDGVALWLLSDDHQWDQRCLIGDLRMSSSVSTKGVWDCGGVLVLCLEERCEDVDNFRCEDVDNILYDATTEKMFKAILHRDVAPEWMQPFVNALICWGYTPALMSPSSIVGKLNQVQETCSGECSTDMMKALKPVTEQDKRKGLEATLDIMCFMDFLVRIMHKLPENLQQVVEMKMMDSDDPDISFESVLFEDQNF